MNVFLSNGLVSWTEQMDFILNCAREDHEEIFQTILSMYEIPADSEIARARHYKRSLKSE